MTRWELVAFVTWALWIAQTLLVVFWFLPRAGHFWAHEGYVMGREDERTGRARVAFVRLPPRKGER